ncbi:hypothetical protein PG994_006933 [Apiospora phragmitis]|uniref:Uncharacterized protein n=1 Tax=Apiospora phragmitis TaxID=2905665 RepID=A0ABR1VGP4_9PEZI
MTDPLLVLRCESQTPCVLVGSLFRKDALEQVTSGYSFCNYVCPTFESHPSWSDQVVVRETIDLPGIYKLDLEAWSNDWELLDSVKTRDFEVRGPDAEKTQKCKAPFSCGSSLAIVN